MERVAIILAKTLSKNQELKVHLIVFSKQDGGYEIPKDVIFHQPTFNTVELSFFMAFIKAIRFIRSVLKKTKPDSLISFGDRYNAFVILASLGLKIKVFVSNRQNPLLSNGRLVDLLNKMLYPLSDGIIAQTEKAKVVFEKKYRQKNITVIPNPITLSECNVYDKKEFILNVGRFADQKNQHNLVHFFNNLDSKGWNLIFLGDGPKRQLFEGAIANLKPDKKVEIKGFVHNVEEYYCQASIFAFTSLSEGFPNALAEAMAAGCACISFDCMAGPSDLIDDGVNGFLVPVDNHTQYQEKLQKLVSDKTMRERFGLAAIEKMKHFNEDKIGRQFLDFIILN